MYPKGIFPKFTFLRKIDLNVEFTNISVVRLCSFEHLVFMSFIFGDSHTIFKFMLKYFCNKINKNNIQ